LHITRSEDPLDITANNENYKDTNIIRRINV